MGAQSNDMYLWKRSPRSSADTSLSSACDSWVQASLKPRGKVARLSDLLNKQEAGLLSPESGCSERFNMPTAFHISAHFHWAENRKYEKALKLLSSRANRKTINQINQMNLFNRCYCAPLSSRLSLSE